MKFSLFQFNPIWEDKKGNQQKIIKYIDESDLSTDVLLFPEMTLTGFTMRSKRYSESINGETINFFRTIAQKNNMHIFAGFIEEENEKYYNTLFHINKKGDIENKYQKIHPFSFSGESRHYNAGTNLVITKIDGLQTGLSICYDLRFPELFRQYGKSRVDAIINIANWPVVRIEHWQHLLKSRAIENLCYVVGVNRVGRDKGNEYNGQSSVYGPMGENILKFGKSEDLKTLDIDITKVKKARENFPFLDDIKLL